MSTEWLDEFRVDVRYHICGCSGGNDGCDGGNDGCDGGNDGCDGGIDGMK